jgi:putative ABC transport system permease protein
MTEGLKLLAGAVLLVLTIACTNVAALQLSRGERRVLEVAVRSSLGAGRGRVARQMLTESTLLAMLGGACGLPVAFLLHQLLVRMSPLDPTAVVDFRLDGRLFAVTVALSTVAGLLTGLLPALRLSATEPYAVLKGGRGATARWRSLPGLAILCGQVAVTLVLLGGAGLLLRSLAKLATVDTGFDRNHVTLVSIDADQSRFRNLPAVEWGNLLREKIAGLPGVQSGALAAEDIFRGGWNQTVWVDGYSYQSQERQVVGFNEVGAGFFETVGIPLLAGRGFLPTDRIGTPPVAIVNRAFVRKYFRGGEAIGRRFRDGRRSYEIVGVVADARRYSLYDPPEPAAYASIEQDAEPLTYPLMLHVQTSLDATTLVGPIRRTVAGIDPELEVRRLQTLEDAVGETLRQQRMLSTALSLFAGVTLLLTAVGLYGTIAHEVARRTAEIGVRMALGAGPMSIVGTMLGQAVLVVAIGCAAGFVVSALALRSVQAMLFEVGPWDPLSLTGAVLGLALIGLGAATLPALSAARMSPMAALRHE